MMFFLYKNDFLFFLFANQLHFLKRIHQTRVLKKSIVFFVEHNKNYLLT